jgi:hypothetical protein
MSLSTRFAHWWLGLRLLPHLLFRAEMRRVFREMFVFCREMPAFLRQPIPQYMHQFTPTTQKSPTLTLDQLRDLADLAALTNRRTGIGICLRRSLVRFRFLREAGLPLHIQFGARFKEAGGKRDIGGHAWTTLAGKPYFEADENWRNFTVMMSFPK